ncbi:MAG: CinA family nicotinamide mononucleotide deamidase-related protein [Saprospiraceae bacterium]
MTVHILTIGDELLLGQVVDTNSARMAQMLLEIGAKVVGKSAVADSREDILAALDQASQKAGVVLITGGLGPTKDDRTKKVLAEYFGVGFVFHQPTLEWLNKLYERFDRVMTDSVRDQCFMPQNATVLPNKMGSAPGMWFEEKGKVFVSMPGVPYEMTYLMEYEVLPRLSRHFATTPTVYRTLLTAGEAESYIAEKLADFENSLPPAVKLAYLPRIGQVRLRLTVSGTNEEQMQNLLDEKFAEMEGLLPPELVAGYDDDVLEIAIGKLLKSKNLTLSTAESCTGGYLAHLITSVPGSSAYFMGSVISYSNEVKMNQLHVSEKTLREHGAVSEQTVKEMVKGALSLLKTNLAIAVSGIAGPDGGTPEKPVGTVWIAVGDRNTTETHQLKLGKDRLRNIQYSAIHALNMLRLFVGARY